VLPQLKTKTALASLASPADFAFSNSCPCGQSASILVVGFSMDLSKGKILLAYVPQVASGISVSFLGGREMQSRRRPEATG
jgi:hypothetical protein